MSQPQQSQEAGLLSPSTRGKLETLCDPSSQGVPTPKLKGIRASSAGSAASPSVVSEKPGSFHRKTSASARWGAQHPAGCRRMPHPTRAHAASDENCDLHGLVEIRPKLQLVHVRRPRDAGHTLIKHGTIAHDEGLLADRQPNVLDAAVEALLPSGSLSSPSGSSETSQMSLPIG